MVNKIRILIVDDSHSFRKGMRALLSIQPEMEVVGEAPNGDSAIEIIEKLHPGLILLDERMPGMSGSELTRLIKNRWPQTKVILMTMYSENRARALEAGADAFVTKGNPPQRILSLIRNIASI